MRFGRRSQRPDDGTGDAADLQELGAEEAGPAASDPDGAAHQGPWDEAEVEVDEEQYVDLGGLLLRPDEGMEIRLQVDEQSGEVMAALLVNEEGALEVRAFAAARGEDAWAELRPQIAAETARMGGTATEADGPLGPELRCLVPVPLPEGGSVTQPSRVIGYQGPRWLLRATLMGRPAQDDADASAWEHTIRRTVVRRGRDAMPPGAPLPLRLPPDARPVG